MQNVANAAAGTAEADSKTALKERALGELEKYVVITVYLWLLFALFSLHKQLVQGHGISIWQQGFAIVNAVIFGKVILIGQALEVGKAPGAARISLGHARQVADLRDPAPRVSHRRGSDSGVVRGSTALGRLRRFRRLTAQPSH